MLHECLKSLSGAGSLLVRGCSWKEARGNHPHGIPQNIVETTVALHADKRLPTSQFPLQSLVGTS